MAGNRLFRFEIDTAGGKISNLSPSRRASLAAPARGHEALVGPRGGVVVASAAMKTRLVIALAILGGALALAACKKEPTRWDEAATATLPASTAPKIEGKKLNPFLPADGTDGYSRTFTQEKDGFVEAKLKKDGQDVAVLSISDASGDEAAKSKFATATDKLSGHPLVTVGKNQSAVLVHDRYQIKVSSQTLDADARKALLAKFDIDGLAKL